ncbi:primase-helicase family protein [Phocaeicola coprocola]|uniref:primase-helicase family protein n=1 Tax=Phocaeicola coprocola TaxID=310298 RepID=UPI003991589C
MSTDETLRNESPFVRVGTTLYKIVNQPRLNGGYVKKRIVWNNETLRQDYGKDYLANVPKYDGFCTVPDHVNYRQVIDNFLNLYEPIGHQPKEGGFSHIQALLHHIFGEQYELGMDYLQLLYLQPVQKLPILLLVSEERNTGKSTFLNFLKAMFRNNVTFNTNEDFRSQFNSDWAGKLIIVVDEVLLNRREDSERLKNLSTTLSYKVEAKGKDRDEIAFFAKFVLCSNNERLPVIIDPGETRYWVRKIHHLENDDTHFLQKLIEEIPAFLYFLQHRTLTTQNVSRMWFSPKQTETAALLKIIRCNKSKYEVEAAELIKEIMECMEIDSFSFCLNDLLILLNLSQVRIDKHWLRKIVTEDWKLAPAPNGLTYTTYLFACNKERRFEPIRRVGRYYTITRKQLDEF